MPVHSTYRATKGTFTFTMDVALTNVRLDAPAPRSLFTRVKMPHGTQIQRSSGSSMTFYPNVAAATRAADFAPVLTVPLSGMRISDIAFEPRAGAFEPQAGAAVAGAMKLQAVDYPALRVLYRRGLQWLQIETFSPPAGGLPAWFIAAIDRRGGNQTATLKAGLFAGREAHSWSTVSVPALAGNEISPIVVDSGVLVADESTAVLDHRQPDAQRAAGRGRDAAQVETAGERVRGNALPAGRRPHRAGRTPGCRPPSEAPRAIG